MKDLEKFNEHTNCKYYVFKNISYFRLKLRLNCCKPPSHYDISTFNTLWKPKPNQKAQFSKTKRRADKLQNLTHTSSRRKTHKSMGKAPSLYDIRMWIKYRMKQEPYFFVHTVIQSSYTKPVYHGLTLYSLSLNSQVSLYWYFIA